MQTSKLKSPYSKIAAELFKKGGVQHTKRTHLSLRYKAFIPLESIITGLAFLLLDFYTKLSLSWFQLG